MEQEVEEAKVACAAPAASCSSDVEEIEEVLLANVRVDHNLVARIRCDPRVVGRYQDLLSDGQELPPLLVVEREGGFVVVDGTHRYEAHVLLKRERIRVVRFRGRDKDCFLRSVEVNVRHGYRLSKAETDCAIFTLLKDPEWREWSDREIGRRVGVCHKTVAARRAELAGSSQATNETGTAPTTDGQDGVRVERNGTQYVMRRRRVVKRKLPGGKLGAVTEKCAFIALGGVTLKDFPAELQALLQKLANVSEIYFVPKVVRSWDRLAPRAAGRPRGVKKDKKKK